jgi:hypothetical protein
MFDGTWGTNAVTTKLTFRPTHPAQEIFENYVFNRLPEEEIANFEMHLLICESCQDALKETIEFIRLMKAGTASYISQHRGTPFPGRFRPAVRWNVAAAALVLTTLVALLSWRTPVTEPRAIAMDAYRGAGTRAPSGEPLELKIDLKDVKPAAGYQVEIVDAAGGRVWFGRTPARINKGLSPGMYWVRLSTNTGEPLREYGLTVGKVR